jgi:hypothetical protein
VSSTIPGKHLGDQDSVAADDSALEPVVVESIEHVDPTPTTAIEVIADAARREVVCPECGTSATITVNRREAQDFCRRCDFPLFWTPAAIVLDASSSTASDALRRLPGTAGRVTVGKLDCPHCAESNPVTNTHCVRCQGDLHPVLPPPPPAPAVLAPPPDEPEPEPVKGTPWWVWAGIGLTVLLAIVLVLFLTLG